MNFLTSISTSVYSGKVQTVKSKVHKINNLTINN